MLNVQIFMRLTVVLCGIPDDSLGEEAIFKRGGCGKLSSEAPTWGRPSEQFV